MCEGLMLGSICHMEYQSLEAKNLHYNLQTHRVKRKKREKVRTRAPNRRERGSMRGLLGLGRQPPPLPLFPAAKKASPYATLLRSLRRFLPASRLLRLLLLLAALSLVAPVFFHLRLRRFHRMRERTCGWIASPPMVCAHGGDSTNAFPNSMDALRMALDVSRSSDGTLFALHDRDLQRMSGNSTAKVGH
ncbi:hypothetical protein QYE76_064220 [Lolium multiflorum]|uniref:Glycerophosphodiester phosphodiesterase n=1 Tax=Lolium multiflorum TaxID=4521 RepID=A0AAD8W8X8_LOLMU|nr:hypothetical protein QYE76_064220 [Lolium multiflorum]